MPTSSLPNASHAAKVTLTNAPDCAEYLDGPRKPRSWSVSAYKAGSPVTILQKHGYKKRSGWATYARTFAKSLIASISG
jgi:hypothetical protein